MFRDLCPALANKTYFNYGKTEQEASHRNGFGAFETSLIPTPLPTL